MKHTLAIDILKNEIDQIMKNVLIKEKQISDLVYQVEEMTTFQNEVLETIKHLGAHNVNEQQIPLAVGTIASVSGPSVPDGTGGQS